MHEADLDTVIQVENAVYRFPWSIGNFRDSLKAEHDAWVVEIDGRLTGYAVLMWLPEEVHLLNLTVSAECQRRGLGRALLGWLIQNTRERGGCSMMLEVRPSNQGARDLYRSFRFVQIGLRKRYYPAPAGAREDALVLRLAYAIE
ncbi:MAG: ribosomal protein S18-alanine N-acetyltransferase [Quisquiliibacterium sp.]